MSPGRCTGVYVPRVTCASFVTPSGYLSASAPIA